MSATNTTPSTRAHQDQGGDAVPVEGQLVSQGQLMGVWVLPGLWVGVGVQGRGERQQRGRVMQVVGEVVCKGVVCWCSVPVLTYVPAPHTA